MEELKVKLAELLEVDVVTDTDILENFDCWDSLTVLSIISMVSETYDKILNAEQVREAKTIGGLCKVILN